MKEYTVSDAVPQEKIYGSWYLNMEEYNLGNTTPDNSETKEEELNNVRSEKS